MSCVVCCMLFVMFLIGVRCSSLLVVRGLLSVVTELRCLVDGCSMFAV